MAKILLVTSSVPAILYSATELARRLAAAGHEVTYASCEQSARTVSSNGLEFLALERSRYEAFLAADSKESSLSRLRHLRSRRKSAIDSLAIGSLHQVLRATDPDLIVIEGEMHEHVIVAFSSGVPLALLNSFVSIWRQPGLPPPHTLARPGVGWKGSRLGIELLWKSLRLRKWRRAWLQKVQRIGCDRLSLLRQLARDSGFDFRRETDDSQWLMPFTYRHLPVLSMHAQEFEFPHRPPKSVHYIGPMLLETRADERVTNEIRAEVETIVGQCRDSQRTVIFAAFGSFFSTDLDHLRRLIDAVAARNDWALVISLGGQIAPVEIGPLPRNVHAFGWLPQLEVLRKADVAVIHGGINTVDECVLFGVPMLVYCGFETDMAGTTSRVVHHGLGIAGDRQKDSPRVIRERIETLLDEPSFRDNLQRLQSQYEAYAEDRVAERTVDAILRQRRAGN